MKNLLRRGLNFLGLVEDDYGDYENTGLRPYEEPEEYDDTRSFPRSAPRRPASVAPAPRPSSPITVVGGPAAPRVRAAVAPLAPRVGYSSFNEDRDVAVYVPTHFNDSKRITDLLRQNRCVLVKTLGVDSDLARRTVDYACGTVFALNGAIEKLAPHLFLLSPQGLHVTPDVKDRLRVAL
jgi:FtsZ-interacting cell division protein YlmF